MPAGRVNLRHEFLLLVVQAADAALDQQARKPDDRIERRSQLVTHRRQKLALGPRRRLGRLRCGAKLFLGRLPFRRVDPRADDAHRPAAGIALDRPAPVEHPFPGAGLGSDAIFGLVLLRAPGKVIRYRSLDRRNRKQPAISTRIRV